MRLVVLTAWSCSSVSGVGNQTDVKLVTCWTSYVNALALKACSLTTPHHGLGVHMHVHGNSCQQLVHGSYTQHFFSSQHFITSCRKTSQDFSKSSKLCPKIKIYKGLPLKPPPPGMPPPPLLVPPPSPPPPLPSPILSSSSSHRRLGFCHSGRAGFDQPCAA